MIRDDEMFPEWRSFSDQTTGIQMVRRWPVFIDHAIQEGRLKRADMHYALALLPYTRRAWSRRCRGRRVTIEELAADARRSEQSVRRSIARMMKAELLLVVSPEIGQLGAIYHFTPAGRSGSGTNAA